MTNYSELPKVPPAWGDPLKIHTATGFVRRTHIARAVSLSILFSGAMLATLLDPEAVKQGDLPSVAVWGVLLLLSLAFLGWAIRLKHHKVAIYSKGLAVIRGKKVVITLWDDVMQVFQQIMTVRRRGFRRRTTHLFTIKTKEGTDIRLGNLFEGIVEIGETVQDEVTRRLLPDILAHYKMGEAIQYTSAITLNKQGIQVRNKAVDWGDIEGFKSSKGFLTIRKTGKRLVWQTFLVASLPNYFMLLKLLEQGSGLRIDEN